MEDQKTSFLIKILAVGNVLSLVMVLGVIGYLVNNNRIKTGQPIPKEIVTKIPEAITLQESDANRVEMKDGVYVLEITDNGFTTEGMSVPAGQKISLEVKNSSSKSYSFEMKGIDAGSATIEPGETKKFTVQAPSVSNGGTGYSYKAVAQDGSRTEFKGALIFTKG